MKKESVYIMKRGRPIWDAEACSVIACGVPAGAMSAYLAVEPKIPIAPTEKIKRENKGVELLFLSSNEHLVYLQ